MISLYGFQNHTTHLLHGVQNPNGLVANDVFRVQKGLLEANERGASEQHCMVLKGCACKGLWNHSARDLLIRQSDG